jgi:hypothetical protein
VTERRRIALALGATVVLAAVLRRWGWENWSFWLDESLQFFVASHPIKEIIALLRNERTHPPLDYLLTHVALQVGTSALFLRWVPTLLSVATLPLVFARAGGMQQPFQSLGSAFALAVLPFAVHQGQELRPYSLALFSVAAADVSRQRHEETGAWGALGLEALASIAAVYSLIIAFFPLAVFWALDAAACRGEGAAAARARRRTLIVPAGTVLAFVPWLLAVRSNLLRPNEMPAPPLSPRLLLEFAAGFVSGREAGLRFALGAAAVAAVAALGLAVAGSATRTRLALELAGVVLSSAVFLKVTNHWFEMRYFWFAMWPLARLLGEGLGAVDRLGPRLRVPAFAGAAAVLLAAEMPGLAENAAWGRVDWRPPARYIAYEAARGRGGPVVPADWWSYMLLFPQRAGVEPAFRIEEPCLAPADLPAVLARIPEGWISRVKEGSSALGESLEKGAKPWASFDRADSVRLYRFENGRIVPP